MKITKILAIIFAIASIGLAAAGLAFMDWDEMGLNYDFHNQFKVYAFLFGILMIVFFIIAIAKKSKFVIIPLLGFVPTGIYFGKKLYENIAVNRSILDVVSPIDNTSVLTLLLFAGFIACVIVSIIKENKFTQLFVVGYLALLILTNIKFLTEITMVKDLMPITFVTYSMVAGFAAFMLFFVPCFCKCNEEKPAEEPVVEKTEE